MKNTSVPSLGISFQSIFSPSRFFCLHPRGRLYDGTSSLPRHETLDCIEYYYSTGEPDENGHIDRRENVSSLGLGDFLFYNLMLLWVLPPLSSMTTQVCVLVGHIIVVEIGEALAFELANRHYFRICPALPLPVVAVSFYALVLDVLIN